MRFAAAARVFWSSEVKSEVKWVLRIGWVVLFNARAWEIVMLLRSRSVVAVVGLGGRGVVRWEGVGRRISREEAIFVFGCVQSLDVKPGYRDVVGERR